VSWMTRRENKSNTVDIEVHIFLFLRQAHL